MSTTSLYIREYAGLGTTEQSDSIPVPCEDGTAIDQVVSLASGAASSNPFNPKTKWVLLLADEPCSIVFSSSAAPIVAAITNWLLPANVPRLFRVPKPISTANAAPPATFQVSAIANT